MSRKEIDEQIKDWLDYRYFELIEIIFELQETIEKDKLSLGAAIEARSELAGLKEKAKYIDGLRNEYLQTGAFGEFD